MVEEAGIDGNDSRVGCGDLLDGAPRRTAAGRNEAQVRTLEVDLEGMAREEFCVLPGHLKDRVRNAGGHDRKPRWLPAGRVGGEAADRQHVWQDPEKAAGAAARQSAHLPAPEPATPP